MLLYTQESGFPFVGSKHPSTKSPGAFNLNIPEYPQGIAGQKQSCPRQRQTDPFSEFFCFNNTRQKLL